MLSHKFIHDLVVKIVHFIKSYNIIVINVQHKCPKGMQLMCAFNFYDSPKDSFQLFKTKVPLCQFAGVTLMHGG